MLIRRKGRCGVFAGNFVWSTSERIVVEVLTIGAIQVHFPFLYFYCRTVVHLAVVSLTWATIKIDDEWGSLFDDQTHCVTVTTLSKILDKGDRLLGLALVNMVFVPCVLLYHYLNHWIIAHRITRLVMDWFIISTDFLYSLCFSFL